MRPEYTLERRMSVQKESIKKAKAVVGTTTANIQDTQVQEEVGFTLLRLLSRRPCTSLVAELDRVLRAYCMDRAKVVEGIRRRSR